MNGNIKQRASFREQPAGGRLQRELLNSSGRIPCESRGRNAYVTGIEWDYQKEWYRGINLSSLTGREVLFFVN